MTNNHAVKYIFDRKFVAQYYLGLAYLRMVLTIGS